MKLPNWTTAKKKPPTVKAEWLLMYDRRPPLFWWRVACVVRHNRIRHKDKEKIKAVCALIDQHYPLKSEYIGAV